MSQQAATTYIHGTKADEQERLAALNRMTNRAFVEFLQVHPNTSVLEVGSGLGILASQVATAATGIKLTGLELSPEQIAAAAETEGVKFIQGDAHSLPFPDDSFDLVYARYLLEHVSDPEQVVREMRRVLRLGGRIAVQENDISLLRVDPPCTTFQEVWRAFGRLQKRLGGDALIGSRLFRLLRDSGLTEIELSVQPEVHWHGSPTFIPWIRNLIGNVESGRERLIDERLCDARQIESAVRELQCIMQNQSASSVFVWNRATGKKP